MKKCIVVIITLFVTLTLKAQIHKPVVWSYAAKKISKNETVIYLKATIEDGWHMYSNGQKGEGPVKTSLKFMQSNDFNLIGKMIEPKPITKYDDTFEMNISYFEKLGILQQKVRLNKPIATVKGSLEFMVCNNLEYLPPETVNFNILIN